MKLLPPKRKINEAIGFDEIKVKPIKSLGDSEVVKSMKALNKIYDFGKIPTNLNKSIFISLLKKPCGML